MYVIAMRSKNEDEIDESHKSQLKFEYKVYFFKLHNKNKNLET